MAAFRGGPAVRSSKNFFLNRQNGVEYNLVTQTPQYVILFNFLAPLHVMVEIGGLAIDVRESSNSWRRSR
jgi:hypothetical protein